MQIDILRGPASGSRVPESTAHAAVALMFVALAALALSPASGQAGLFEALVYATLAGGVALPATPWLQLSAATRLLVVLGAPVGASAVATWRLGISGEGPPLVVLFAISAVALLPSRAAALATLAGLAVFAGAWTLHFYLRVPTPDASPAVALAWAGSLGAACWIVASLRSSAWLLRTGSSETPTDHAVAPPRSVRGESLAPGEAANRESDILYQRVLEQATDALFLQDYEREQMLSAFVETSRDWFWAVDLQGKLTYTNAAVEQILGYRPATLLGTRKADLLQEEERKLLLAASPYPGAEPRSWRNLLLRYRHVDDTIRYLESSAVPIVAVDGHLCGFHGVDRDVTERIVADEERSRLEQQIRQRQKLEAIGSLAGGVAHDFNNVLQAILSAAALARLASTPGAPGHEHLTEIEASAQRAAELTRQLLAFGRQQLLRPAPLRPHDLLTNLLRMLRRLLSANISLRYDPTDVETSVRADPGQLEQVIINLCVNARDAMPNGGEIVLRVEVAQLDADFCLAHPGANPGRYVVISVSDTGEGMSRETQERVFEPFFTTKEPAKGTGLGLSTAYGIIKQHGGILDVESRLGAGSTFHIYLPAIELEPAPSQRGATREPPGGQETILVAEDEGPVRRLAEQMLKQAGYRVLTAEDGARALALLERHADSVDLVLLDVVMPELSGPQVEAKLREVAPQVKVLFTTGYAAKEQDQRFGPGRSFELLCKPYSREDLLRRIRSMLDQPRS